MTDINMLEDRLRAALDRIAAHLDANDGPPAVVTGPDDLMQRLLVQGEQLRRIDQQLQQLRASNVQLREANAALRAAAMAEVAPDNIDAAMAAEIAALHTQRSADAAEVDAILAELTPLIEEAHNAAD